MKYLLRRIAAPFARPILRRVRIRMDSRLAPIEARLAAAESRLGPTDRRLDGVEIHSVANAAAREAAEARISTLESGWKAHIPGFLNAASSVGALGRQVAGLKAGVAADRAMQLERLSLLETQAGARQGQLDVVLSQISGLERRGDEAAGLLQELPSQVAGLHNCIEQVQSRWQETQDQVSGTRDQVGQLMAHTVQADQQMADSARQISELWQRIEFVRRETLFEFAHGSRAGSEAQTPGGSEPRVIAVEKLAAVRASGDIRLNLGCGHIALPDYVNIDRRELPGVDIVAEIDNLPFDPGTVHELSSAHLVEHFPLEAFRRRILPYWRRLLQPGGVLRAVTPDAAAMIAASASGTYPFEEFREVMFGAQDYEGDYHYNLFTPASLSDLLAEAGFVDIQVPVSSRRNGKCYEFEIVGVRV